MDRARLRTEVIAVMRDNTQHGTNQQPGWVSAYQVLNRLPDDVRDALIADEGGVGGRANDAGRGTGAANAVMRVLCRLNEERMVDIDYFDAHNDTWFSVGSTTLIRPGNVTCAIYRWHVSP